MLTRQKIIDLRLEEEKFYFPGETIKGVVLVNPKSPIKVNSIQLKFTGLVFIHLKEKETTTLFNETQTLQLEAKTVLDVKEHGFQFEFVVPKNLNLPSSMEFGKKAHIRYTISAVLDRPMVPESLCPKVDYAVSLLEYIDIDTPQFLVPQEKIEDVMLSHAKYNQKCMVRVSMPRFGFTRGDIVPLKVTVDHFTSFSRKNGVTVQLVRTVEIRTSRHTIFKESVLRSMQYNLNIKTPRPSQTDQSQLLIPTSTPPSIRYKDKVIRFHYKVRVIVSFNDQHPCTIEIPIVLGTWPKAAIPIDDDDDDDDHTEIKMDDVDDDADIESLPCSIEDFRTRNSMIHVGRADSTASRTSRNSISSWHSWDNTNNLTRNTSLNTTLSSPERFSNARTSICSSSSEYPARSFEPNSNTNSRHSSFYSNAGHLGGNRLRYNKDVIVDNFVDDVPTHILEPVSSNFAPPSASGKLAETFNDSYSSSESSLDSDDDDLLAIIQRKKKKERKELKKKQAMLQAQ